MAQHGDKVRTVGWRDVAGEGRGERGGEGVGKGGERSSATSMATSVCVCGCVQWLFFIATCMMLLSLLLVPRGGPTGSKGHK